MSKEEIRQRAAIAVLPECVRETHEVLSNGGKLIEETQAKQAAMMAVAYADELVKKLKGNGWSTIHKCKFAIGDIIVNHAGDTFKVTAVNYLKSEYTIDDCANISFDDEDYWESAGKAEEQKQELKKDVTREELDELKVREHLEIPELEHDHFMCINGDPSVIDYTKMSIKQKDFGEVYKPKFDVGDIIANPAGDTSTVTMVDMRLKRYTLDYNTCIDFEDADDDYYVKAGNLSNLEQNGKNSKPANLSKSSKFWQALVNEEIKRRCDAIDATKMSDRYYHMLCEQWFKCDVAHDRELGYMKGVEDTIKKLKGE